MQPIMLWENGLKRPLYDLVARYALDESKDESFNIEMLLGFS